MNAIKALARWSWTAAKWLWRWFFGLSAKGKGIVAGIVLVVFVVAVVTGEPPEEGTPPAAQVGAQASPEARSPASATSSPTPSETYPPVLQTDTLDVQIVECVQTWTYNEYSEETRRSPNIIIRVTNEGPARLVMLDSAVKLEARDFDDGWKPTGHWGHRLESGETYEGEISPDYRHQSSYTEDGLEACRIDSMTIRDEDGGEYPNYPERTVELDLMAEASPEREAEE